MSLVRVAYVGNQLPILLIDFVGISASWRSSWESVTNPLDRLPEDWFFLGIARFSGLRTIQIRSPERYFWHFSGPTKEKLEP